MRRLVFGAIVGLMVGCFDAPAADVMFSCEPDGASACPDGYTCEADGCCHRDGSDVDAHLGECKLQGGTDGATTVLPGTSSSGTDATTSSGSSDGTSTGGTSTGGTSTGGTSTGDASTGGTSSEGGSSSGAGSTDSSTTM